MKLKGVFFICLISNIFCINIVGKNDQVKITSSSSSGYVYVKLKDFDSDDDFYVLVEATKGSISTNIYIAYSNSATDDSPSGLNFQSWSNFGSVTTTDSQGYYYQLENKRDKYDYLVINYYGFSRYSNGYLIIKTYDVNPLATIVKIVLIVVGTIFGLAIIITIIIIACCCCRRRQPVNYIAGINTVAPLTPVYSQQPFINNNQPYQNYQTQPYYPNQIQPSENLYNKPT